MAKGDALSASKGAAGAFAQQSAPGFGQMGNGMGFGNRQSRPIYPSGMNGGFAGNAIQGALGGNKITGNQPLMGQVNNQYGMSNAIPFDNGSKLNYPSASGGQGFNPQMAMGSDKMGGQQMDINALLAELMKQRQQQ